MVAADRQDTGRLKYFTDRQTHIRQTQTQGRRTDGHIYIGQTNGWAQTQGRHRHTR